MRFFKILSIKKNFNRGGWTVKIRGLDEFGTFTMAHYYGVRFPDHEVGAWYEDSTLAKRVQPGSTEYAEICARMLFAPDHDEIPL